jgi:[glutamine synthetase] adenylyltransferase / [glutamine synthetase]-adenylyl-L-tyrosine phosphorylase
LTGTGRVANVTVPDRENGPMFAFDVERLPRATATATDRVVRARERWSALAHEAEDPAIAAFVRAVASDRAGSAVLDAVFAHSPYLTESLLKESAFLRTIAEHGIDAAVAGAMADAGRQDPSETTPALMHAMRIAKRRVSLGVALADIAEAWSLERVTGTLSDLAAATLDRAAAHLLRRAVATGDLQSGGDDHPCRESGLIVLGMGKLGACELNYSSDIDVIVLFDEDRVRTRRPDTLQRTFVRIARDLIRIMEERSADGYVFRTDLRLRPDPAATPLAVSVASADSYYGSVGQNWERAAMIKARPVAGDTAAGRDFLDTLRPWIWRRHLDFAAIQDIHSIKRQINAHRGHKVVAVNGHDVKVGRGGIREIEFFVQTQQLIWGGRDPRLRSPRTLGGLEALVAAGRVDRRVADEMAQSYGFLRRLEHRLQMIDDRQTHALPADDAGVDAVAAFLGYETPRDFRVALRAHLERVEDRYAALFEEAPALAGPGNLVFTGQEDDPATVETLSRMGYANPAGVMATIRGWHHGRYRSTRSQRARELLTELVPVILDRLAGSSQPDSAFSTFDGFLAGLPAGVQLFSLFHANPKLLDLLADILGTAPRFAEALARRPTLLDAVLEPGFFGMLPDATALEADLDIRLGPVTAFEEALDVVRRWATEMQFRAVVLTIRGSIESDWTGPFLSDVAEVALRALQPRVEATFAQRHGRCAGGGIALVALGKLGERRMSIGSDLDLIAIYDVADTGAPSDGEKPLFPSEYYIRLTARLIAAVTSLTAEGRLYDVDMRLRPSGNKGPLAVSLEGFVAYQTTGAWTWEHQALTRARIVTGPPDLAPRIAAAVRAVLARPRDPAILLHDVVDMRRRIDGEYRTADPWSVKHLRGGLVDVEFVAQWLVLRHAATMPAIVTGETGTTIAAAAALGFLTATQADALLGSLVLCRHVQAVVRMVSGQGGFDPATAPESVRRVVARAALGPNAEAVDFPSVEPRIIHTTAAAHAVFRAILEIPAAARAEAETSAEKSGT